MEIIKRNNNETSQTLQKVLQRGTAISQALIQAGTAPSELERISQRMPTTIEQALDFPVVVEVVKLAGVETVQAYIHFELMKLAHLVSVGGNLNDQQAAFVAQELIKLFPNETLADFRLCFQRGAIGQYGEIYRMDGIVIRGWMEKYLEEKYQVIEKRLVEEKDEMYKPTPRTLTEEVKEQQIKDRLQEWKSAIEASANDMKVPGMSEETIKETGKEKVKKSAITGGYASYMVRGIMVQAESQEAAERQVAIAERHGLVKPKE